MHLTVANLQDKFHRASEAPTTEALLQAIFPDRTRFSIHPALPASAWFGDEGAANHNRLGGEYGAPGVQLFVYGRRRGSEEAPRRYPARQTLEASQAVARLNQVNPRQLIFARQHPAAIDTGVFHNDVIAVSNRQVLFCREQAFADQTALLQQLAQRVPGFTPLVVPASRVSVAEAVATYLFNSQLVSRADGSMAPILPQEAQEHAGVWEYLNELLAGDNPIADLRVFDLRESMANGGGPACLRLRVVLTAEEYQAVNPHVLMNDTLFATLNDWVDRYLSRSSHPGRPRRPAAAAGRARRAGSADPDPAARFGLSISAIRGAVEHFLALTPAGRLPHHFHGETAHFRWHWLGEGILS